MALFATIAGMPGAARAGVAAIGVMGGATGARLHGDYGDDVGGDHRAGSMFGASARFALRPGLSFQPELWWILKGGQADFSIAGIAAHVEHSVPYVEMPLLVRLELPGGGFLAPFVSAGPTVAVRAGGDLDLALGSGGLTTPLPRVQGARIFEEVGTFDDPNFSDWDFGVVGAAGVVMGSGRVRLDLEVRYERDFVDVYEHHFLGSAKNGVVAGLLGVEFH